VLGVYTKEKERLRAIYSQLKILIIASAMKLIRMPFEILKLESDIKVQ